MTTSELISILKEYPADSQIAIQIGGAINHFMEIKGVLPWRDFDTDLSYPVLDIDVEATFEKEYAMVIDLKPDLKGDELQQTRKFIEKAFTNRGGSIRNKCTDPYHLEFLGNDIERGCLDIGMVTIENEKRVLSEIVSWKWYDRDHPDENCDILDEIDG